MSEAFTLLQANAALQDCGGGARYAFDGACAQAGPGPADRTGAQVENWPPIPPSRRPSATEFRRLLLAVIRAGRTPEALSRDFEPVVEEIWKWVIDVAWDGGRKADGLTAAEREELGRLRRDVRQMRASAAAIASAHAVQRAGAPCCAAQQWARTVMHGAGGA